MLHPQPEPPSDPTILFRVMAGDVANIFRGISSHLRGEEALDLITAADAVEKALQHVRPGTLTGAQAAEASKPA